MTAHSHSRPSPASRHERAQRGSADLLVAGALRIRQQLRSRAVPTRWSSFLGAVSLGCFLTLLATGAIMMTHFVPQAEPIPYEGSYAPLRGVEVSRAYDSTMALSLEVRGGLVLRQAHHWAALILPASLALQMLTVYFTGSFRRPRRTAWVALCLVFLLAVAAGWTGYALPDDSLAGTGARIVDGIVRSLPFVGTWVAHLLSGGEFPGEIVTRLYWVHVAVVPALLVLAAGVRFALSVRVRPAQPRRSNASQERVIGLPLRLFLVRFAGMVVVTMGVLTIMGGTAAIAPVWGYGPSSPSSASAGSQPDWYTGFLDGALRLAPPGWETDAPGGTWALGILVPQAVAALLIGLIILHPFVEERASRDRRLHHILDRPRDAPTRAAWGAAGLSVYCVLIAAGATDIVATQFHVAFETQVHVLRALLICGPVVAFVATRAVCRALLANEVARDQEGIETGVIVRSPDGGYSEIHRRTEVSVARSTDLTSVPPSDDSPGSRADDRAPSDMDGAA